MTTRFFRLLAWQLLLTLACMLPRAHAADGVEITRAYIESVDEGYKLAASYAFDLNHGLEDAVQHGVPLFFTTEIELTRPRWFWFDEKAIVARRTSRISYNVLTRQYHVSITGNVQQSFASLEDALFLIRRPSRWLVAARGALKPGETYNVTLRMDLDRDYLPKPIQVNAFNNSEWRLSSNKKSFLYKAE
ncbi:hypothetical protein ACFDR9_003454 [Janthinobacterium sp. CG_23.3]|uniref:DUF4390 domain-containing protein n=1 Tax=unclassified Janthinobacterium TaxID=2610881 RepID=UPI000476F229|nr:MULTISPECIES: DUF4390 domain-containing protein [unclassified Janthinobacterium]MEC5163550.1 hypothetical protein [Janthinobacterium sp. CG_S6]